MLRTYENNKDFLQYRLIDYGFMYMYENACITARIKGKVPLASWLTCWTATSL